MFTSKRLIRWFLLALTLGTLITTSASLTEAQCSVRTDWPTYIVQQGDTLAKIAVRYGTNYTTLMAANCIANPNVIYAGQQLRVPPTPGTVITPPPVTTPSTLVASYQPFEHGFMIWKSTNSEIDVYYAPSGVTANGGFVRVFPASVYGGLPDNPYIVPTPSGVVRPAFGFGKVWGNYSDIRGALGWATAPETGYTQQVFPPNSITFQFTLPNGSTVYVNNNQTWAFSSSIPVVVPPTTPNPTVTTTAASYQPFQGGFMVWEAHTGNVVAFYNNSRYQVYIARSYGGLPDNPVLDPTPAGLVRPAFGFGKVWGNFPAVRQMLGWATQGESYWEPSFRSSSPSGFPQTCFLLPDARVVTYAFANNTAFWSFGGTCS